jgi:hypothetical protein
MSYRVLPAAQSGYPSSVHLTLGRWKGGSSVRWHVTFAASFLLLAAPTISSAQVRLAFYGYQSAPTGCYEEGQTGDVFLLLPAMSGPDCEGSSYYLGIRSLGLESYGCDLPDTEVDPGCGAYDLTAWLEPGSVAIGHLTVTDQNAMIECLEWMGHQPTDFSSIRVEFQQGPPCYSTRTLILPVQWVTEPVPVLQMTWGQLRALYRG